MGFVVEGIGLYIIQVCTIASMGEVTIRMNTATGETWVLRGDGWMPYPVLKADDI